MSQTASARTTDTAQPGTGALLRSLLPSIVFSGVLPVVLYQILKRNGVATVPALVAGSVFPIGSTLWSWIKTRRLDFIGVLSLIFILISAAASLISGSTRFTLLKESFFTGLFGLVFLGSLVIARPVMFYIARQFATGGDPEKIAQWGRNWEQQPGFRRVMRVITAVWGGMFIADALIRVALVFVLSVTTFLIVSQVMFYGMFAVTMWLTMAYSRRERAKAAVRRAAHPDTQAAA